MVQPIIHSRFKRAHRHLRCVCQAIVCVAVAGLTTAFVSGHQTDSRDFTGIWQLDPSKTQTTGGPLRVGAPMRGRGMITPPTKVTNVPPRYPAVAMSAHIEGRVLLEAIIDKDGNVVDLTVVRSIPELDSAAVEAVSQWTFTPTLVNGVPVAVVMTVNINFSLGPRPASGQGPPVAGSAVTVARLAMAQDAATLTMTRDTPTGPLATVYRLDGTESRNRMEGRGGLPGAESVSTSRWDGARLVTTITAAGAIGPRLSTETRWLDGDTMIVETMRPLPAGADPFIQRQVYVRVH